MDIYSLSDLAKLAAEFKGLKIATMSLEFRTEPFAKYTLNSDLQQLLAGHKIMGHIREPESIYTFTDENPQVHVPGFNPSNYWNFKREPGKEYDLRILLCLELKFDHRDRGFQLRPLAQGTFLSPCDALPNFRMFKCLTDQDPDALPIAREIAASNGVTTVTWTDLGLGGMRQLRELFKEFAGDRDIVNVLARRNPVKIFSPNPFDYPRDGNDDFIAESTQPSLFKTWAKQLEDFRSQLEA